MELVADASQGSELEAPGNKSEARVDGEVLIRVQDVRKRFCRSLQKSLLYGLKDIAHELNPFRRSQASGRTPGSSDLRPGEFWAVNGVSFELRRGECLGLIGHNGAGKTSLLKMLNGLIKPDAGHIEMRGRVGALIALGAGFNPILTGRENIYVNGAILGLTTREIDEKIESIITFADIGEFIDSPVGRYSSGMQVRLGFAVSTALNPDILILDEVLAVGDFTFRKKCYERIAQMRRDAAVIFVSHQMDQLRKVCSRGLYLNRGSVVDIGDFDTVARLYESHTAAKADEQDYRSKTVIDVAVALDAKVVRFGAPLNLQLTCESAIDLRDVVVRVVFSSRNDEILAEWSSATYDLRYEFNAHRPLRVDIPIKTIPLRPDTYKITVIVSDAENSHYLVVLKRGLSIQVSGVARMIHAVQL